MAEHTKGQLSLSADEGDGRPYIVQRQALYTTLIAEMLRHRPGSADRVRPDEEQTANAERLAACWNACDGMADPAAEIARLRVEMVEARAIMTDAMRSLQACKDAPGAYKTTCTQQLADFLADKPDRLTIAAMSQLG